MKLDVNVLRYLSKDDFRVLTSIEMGQKNVRAWAHMGHACMVVCCAHARACRSCAWVLWGAMLFTKMHAASCVGIAVIQLDEVCRVWKAACDACLPHPRSTSWCLCP